MRRLPTTTLDPLTMMLKRLNGRERRRRTLEVFALCVGLFGTSWGIHYVARQATEDLAAAALADEAHYHQASYDRYFFNPSESGPAHYDYTWRAPESAAAVWHALEEHLVRDERANGDAVRDFYALWRWVLNGPRMFADVLGIDGEPGILVHSYVHGSPSELVAALEHRNVSRGAVVYVDVVRWGLDNSIVANLSSDPSLAFAQHATDQNAREGKIESTCVYHHATDLLRRSRIVRALLSYPEPLVLVLAGDIGCRLSEEIAALEKTHHLIFFAGDVVQSATPASSRWLPQGLDASRLASYDELASVLATFAGQAETPFRARPYLFGISTSTIGVRNPSRERLVTLLARQGLASELMALATKSKRRAFIHVDLAAESVARVADAEGITTALPVPEKDEVSGNEVVATFDVGGGSDKGSMPAVFAIAPAGDVLSSGQVLEALLRGEIPVVDRTYANQPASTKGCADPVAFWQHGDASFPFRAPFVFVDDWSNLPGLLSEFGAANESQLELRFADLAFYRDRLLRHLRRQIIDATVLQPDVASTCETTPLSRADELHQLSEAERYYGNTTIWADNLPRDSPDHHPGCTMSLLGREHPIRSGLCFAPACVPPLVATFHCENTPSASSE